MPSTSHSTVIEAPVDEVWKRIRDFHDVSWATGVLESCEPVGELAGDQIGAGRILNGSFRETLLALNDRDMEIIYQLVDGPSPVSPKEVTDFIAEVRLRSVTDTDHCMTEWSASWEASDGAAVDFAGGIYASLLEVLKKNF